MKRASAETNCPPIVGATEGRCTALEAGANPTYGTNRTRGKRFSRSPALTGNNSRHGVPGGVSSPSGAGGDQPPDDAIVWAWPKRGGEVRASVSLYKGRRFLDIRWWIEKRDGFAATPKGATIPLDAVEGFSEALTALAASMRTDGA